MTDNEINELTEASNVENFKTRTKNEKLKTACGGCVRN